MFAAVPGAVERCPRYSGEAARQRVVAYSLFRPTHGSDVVTRWASCAVTDALTLRFRAPAAATVPTYAGCSHHHHHAPLYYDVACRDTAHELAPLAGDYPLPAAAVHWAAFSTGPSLPLREDARETSPKHKGRDTAAAAAERSREVAAVARQLPMVALLLHRVGPRRASFVLLLRPCVVTHARHTFSLAYGVALREVSVQTRFVLWTTTMSMQLAAMGVADQEGAADMCALLTVSASDAQQRGARGDACTQVARGVCFAMTTQHVARRGVSAVFHATAPASARGVAHGCDMSDTVRQLRWAACRVRPSHSPRTSALDGGDAQQPVASPLARCLRQHEVVLVGGTGGVYVFGIDDSTRASGDAPAAEDTLCCFRCHSSSSSIHDALSALLASQPPFIAVAGTLAWLDQPRAWAALEDPLCSSAYRRDLCEAYIAQQEAALQLRDKAVHRLVAQYDVDCGGADAQYDAAGVRCLAASHSAHALLLSCAPQARRPSCTTLYLVSACAVRDGASSRRAHDATSGHVAPIEVSLPRHARVHDACYVVTDSFAGFLLVGQLRSTSLTTSPSPRACAADDLTWGGIAFWFLPLGSNVCVPVPLASGYAWREVPEEGFGAQTRFAFAVVTPVQDGLGQAGVFVTLYTSAAAQLALTAHLILAATGRWWAHTFLPRVLCDGRTADTPHAAGMSDLVLATRTLRQLVAYAMLADLGNRGSATATGVETRDAAATRQSLLLMLRQPDMRPLGLEYVLLSVRDGQQGALQGIGSSNSNSNSDGGGGSGGAYALLVEVVTLLSDALHDSAQGSAGEPGSAHEIYSDSSCAAIVACITALFDGVADVLPACDAHAMDLDTLLLHVPWLHDVFGLLRDAVHSLAMHGCVSAIARCVLPLAVVGTMPSATPTLPSAGNAGVVSCLLGPIFDDAYAACLRHTTLAAALLPHCSAALRDMSSAACTAQRALELHKQELKPPALVAPPAAARAT